MSFKDNICAALSLTWLCEAFHVFSSQLTPSTLHWLVHPVDVKTPPCITRPHCTAPPPDNLPRRWSAGDWRESMAAAETDISCCCSSQGYRSAARILLGLDGHLLQGTCITWHYYTVPDINKYTELQGTRYYCALIEGKKTLIYSYVIYKTLLYNTSRYQLSL